MKKLCILLLVSIMPIFGCLTTGVTPQKTQLQIRQFQTRSYETNDTKMVMKAMLNVLQDDGFIVKNAVLDLGLLSAEKSVDIENKGQVFLASFIGGANAVWKIASIVHCTANVSEYGSQTRVRVNFQVKVLNNKGGLMIIEQIGDENYYQVFFTKVDKGVFIQKEKL